MKLDLQQDLRIVVTGGGGHVGRGIIRTLTTLKNNSPDIRNGFDIISLDNYSSSKKIDDSKKILYTRYLDCDISKPYREPDSLDGGLERRTGRVFDNELDCNLGQKEGHHVIEYKIGNPDVIFHCAGLSHTYDVAENVDNFKEYQHVDDAPMDLFDANVVGTKNILEFAIHGQDELDYKIRTDKKWKRILKFKQPVWQNPKFTQIFYIGCEPSEDKYEDEYKFTKSLGEELCVFYHKQFNLNIGMFSFKGDTLLSEFCKKLIDMIGIDLKGKKYEF